MGQQEKELGMEKELATAFVVPNGKDAAAKNTAKVAPSSRTQPNDTAPSSLNSSFSRDIRLIHRDEGKEVAAR